jgi:hypothetical protein
LIPSVDFSFKIHFRLFFFVKVNRVKPSQSSGRTNDDGGREALCVLRQDIRSGQKGRGTPEDVFGGLPEGSEEREQQAFLQKESGLLVWQVRGGQGVEKGASRLSEKMAEAANRATPGNRTR